MRSAWRRPGRWIALAMLLSVPFLACAQMPQPRPEIRAEPVQPPGGSLPERIGGLRLEAAHVLSSRASAFGGISAARLDGAELLLLSDRSRLFALAWPVADPATAPRRAFSVPILSVRKLVDARGEGLDAEALARLPDGTLLVSDEGRSRIERFAPGDDQAIGRGRRRPDLLGPSNQGIETLAALPDGSWLAISEGAYAGKDRLVALQAGAQGERRLRYQAGSGYQPTDADAAGDHLFVLERRVSLLGGWRARVVAVPLAALPDHDDGVIRGRELAVLSGPELGENYEALAAARAEDGSYRLLLLSDDNFAPFQRTLLLALRWTPEEEGRHTAVGGGR